MNLLNSKSTIFVTLALSVSVSLLLLPTTEATLGKPRATIDKEQLQPLQKNDDVSKRMLQGLFEESQSDILMIFLQSDECSSFMEILGQSSKDFLEFDDETVIAFACNDIERQEILRTQVRVEADVANHEQGTLTCEIAYKMKLLEQQSAMVEAMSSSESCEAEMSKELEVVHEIHRSLSEMDGHHGRELFFWFFLAIASLVGIILSAYIFFFVLMVSGVLFDGFCSEIDKRDPLA